MKLFVWDLHGTLEFGNHRTVIDISNQVLTQYGHHEQLSYADGLELYGLKWFEYFTWLLGEDSYERAMELQDACFEVSETNLDIQCRWMQRTQHAEIILSKIKANHHQILISNTRASTLEIFLRMLKLDEFFPAGQAFAVDQHTRHATRTKADVLREFLDENNRYEQLVIIGDSPSDMRLRDVAGGLACLFAHPEFEFRDCPADLRIRDLRKLTELV